MEWISNPDQVLSFDDMYPGQPNGPTDQLCMRSSKQCNYKWADIACDESLPYICEFV